MSDITVKDIKTQYDALAKFKLCEPHEFSKDVGEAATAFKNALEAIDPGAEVKGSSTRVAAYNKACELYDRVVTDFPDDTVDPEEEGETESESEEEEEVESEEEEEVESEEEEEVESEEEESEEEEEQEESVAAAKTKKATKAKEKAPVKAKAASKEQTAPAKDAPKKAAAKKDTGPKKPGVVDTIFGVLKEARKATPTTKDAIHKVLVKAFPERDAAKMMVSVNTIVTPKEIERQRGLKLMVDKTERPWKYYLGR